MNNSIENIVSEKLQQFDLLENVTPSEEWKQSVILKLKATKPNSNSPSAFSGFTFSFLIVLMLNIFLAVQFLMNNEEPSSHDEALKIISKEILAINPASANN
jgi:hypothetical protein